MSRQVDVKSLISHLVRGDGIDKCRICMGDTSEGQVFLEDTVLIDSEQPVTLSELLFTITGVQVLLEKGLPNSICNTCSKQAQQAYNYKKKYMDSIKIWHKITEQLLAVPVATIDRKNCFLLLNNAMKVTAITSKTKVNRNKIVSELKTGVRQYKSTMNRTTNLKSLKLNEDASSKLECLYCKQKFISSLYLNRHLVPTNKRICRKCLSFIDKNKLKKHLEEHGFQPKSCLHCAETYLDSNFLKAHIKNHHKGGFTCTQCYHSFATELSLNIHKRIHCYSYCHCGHYFESRRCLNYHKSICNKSTTDKEFICDYCKKVYNKKRSMIDHIQTQHINKKSFECYICSKTFLYLHNMKAHEKSHYPSDDIVCEECGAKFKSREGYKKHMAKKKHRKSNVVTHLLIMTE